MMTKIRRREERYRLQYLAFVVHSVRQIKTAHHEVKIFTNSYNEASKILNWKIPNLEVLVYPQYNRMNSLNNSPWKIDDPENPWHLTWEHKRYLEMDVKKNSPESIYLYLENDSLFTQSNLDYWLEHRPPLKELGLEPSFLRTEWSFKSETLVPIGIFGQDFLELSKLPVRNTEMDAFIQLPNPYSGLYVFDDDLAREHLESPAFTEVASREITWWDIGARSTMGNQFLNPPAGFSSRNVLQLNSEKTGIDERAWVPHLPNIYARHLNFPQGFTPDSFLVP